MYMTITPAPPITELLFIVLLEAISPVAILESDSYLRHMRHRSDQCHFFVVWQFVLNQ